VSDWLQGVLGFGVVQQALRVFACTPYENEKRVGWPGLWFGCRVEVCPPCCLIGVIRLDPSQGRG
jgi:hypothetical protein